MVNMLPCLFASVVSIQPKCGDRVAHLPVVCESIGVEVRFWEATGVNGFQSSLVAIDAQFRRPHPDNGSEPLVKTKDGLVFDIGILDVVAP